MEVLTWLQVARSVATAAVSSRVAVWLFAAVRWACAQGKRAIPTMFSLARPHSKLRVERWQLADGVGVVRLDWSYSGDNPFVAERGLELLTGLASSAAVRPSNGRQKRNRKGPRRVRHARGRGR